MEDILLVGGGGHCQSVLDSLNNLKDYNVVGILDLRENVGSFINGVKIIGTDDECERFFNKGIRKAHISIGSIKSTTLRERIYSELKLIGFEFPLIIDPSALVSSSVEIGEGTFIGKGAIVNCGSKIGCNCIINTGSIIEHECIISDFAHVAPGAVLSGRVTIGRSTLIGTNSTVIQGINIGENVVIGAGSVVIRNIKHSCIAYGNPCKEVR